MEETFSGLFHVKFLDLIPKKLSKVTIFGRRNTFIFYSSMIYIFSSLFYSGKYFQHAVVTVVQ